MGQGWVVHWRLSVEVKAWRWDGEAWKDHLLGGGHKGGGWLHLGCFPRTELLPVGLFHLECWEEDLLSPICHTQKSAQTCPVTFQGAPTLANTYKRGCSLPSLLQGENRSKVLGLREKQSMQFLKMSWCKTVSCGGRVLKFRSKPTCLHHWAMQVSETK
jgi:hypothetical protein